MAWNRCALAVLTLPFVAACGNSAENDVPAVTIGPQGGRVTVDSGPLAGAVLDIPAGALAANVSVTIAPGSAEATPGFLVGGTAAALAPGGAQLAAPATLTLPWNGQGLTVGRTLLPEEDVVLFQRDDGGAIWQLVTGRVDRAAGTVTADIDRLGEFWPALRPSGFAFGLESFLPVDGEVVDFADGSSLRVEVRTDEVGLVGETILRLEFVDPFVRRLQLSPDGDGLALRGLWEEARAVTPPFRMRTDRPVPLLPEAVLERSVVQEPAVYEFFPGFVSGSPAVPGTGSVRLVFGRRTSVQTPERTFVDVLDVLIQWDLGRFGTRQLALLLARDEGVVGFSWDGAPLVLRTARTGAPR